MQLYCLVDRRVRSEFDGDVNEMGDQVKAAGYRGDMRVKEE